jgi:tricorn protease
VQSPSLDAGRIAYQLGADIRVYDIQPGTDRAVPITLVSDFDQMREKWITKPTDWITSAHLSPSGDRVVFTARGGVFVAPAEQGRLVEVTKGKLTRWRNGRFMPDGTSLVALSDQSGELEFWSLPASGIGAASQVTTGGTVFRWDGIPSPDGKWLAHRDLDRRLWILDLAKKSETKIGDDPDGDFDDLTWSPDSHFLAYAAPDANQVSRISVWEAATGKITPITTDRYESYSPAWTADGKWLYFLSDRTFVSTVPSPWGSREPEPFFDRQTKVYHVAMGPGLRSPFQPADELMPKDEDKKDDEKKPEGGKEGKEGKGGESAKASKDSFAADLTGIQARLLEVPLPPGNYNSLSLDDKRLYLISR